MVLDVQENVFCPVDKPDMSQQRNVDQASPASYEIEVFYDGACPLCRRETNWLRRRDKHQKIRFTDISDPDFQASAVGQTHEALMGRIHARQRDGTWLQGVEVFRRLYAAIGFGPLVALSRLPLVSQLLDWGYAAFARNRYRLTGRCPRDEGSNGNGGRNDCRT